MIIKAIRTIATRHHQRDRKDLNKFFAHRRGSFLAPIAPHDSLHAEDLAHENSIRVAGSRVVRANPAPWGCFYGMIARDTAHHETNLQHAQSVYLVAVRSLETLATARASQSGREFKPHPSRKQRGLRAAHNQQERANAGGFVPMSAALGDWTHRHKVNPINPSDSHHKN